VEQWRRVSHARPRKDRLQGRSEIASSPLHLPRRRRQRRYLQKQPKTQQASLLQLFFLCFQSGFSSFRSANSGAGRCTRRQQTRRVDAGSATFLLPFHFCNGGAVHRCHGCEIGAHPNFGFLPLLHYPLAFLLISSLSL